MNSAASAHPRYHINETQKTKHERPRNFMWELILKPDGQFSSQGHGKEQES